MLAALLVAAGAWGSDVCPDEPGLDPAYRSWACVEQARVLEAVEGDAVAAAARYEALVRSELPDEDPALAEALYELGVARWTLGDLDGARAALDRCIRGGIRRGPCTELRTRIDLEADAVHVVPTTWTFDSPAHGFFHPRAFWHKGGLRIVQEGDGHYLAWSTRVDPMQGDQLIVGFRRPAPTPREVRFRARSLEVKALLQLQLVDVEGRRFAPAAPRTEVPVRAWTDVVLVLEDVVPVDPGGRALDPSRLYRLVVSDVTALTGISGKNEIHLDDFTVR